MEQYYTIPTSSGFEINGILNWKEDTDKLIVFIHGFTGSTNEAHYVAARDYFTQRGYAVFRFSLYHGKESCRKLHTSTVADHSYDTQQIIDFFSTQYNTITLVWHSLWGPTIIGVSDFSAIDKIVLWDPALDMKSSAAKSFVKNDILFSWGGSGKNIEVWREMLEEFSNIDYFSKLKNLEYSRSDIVAIYASEDRHVNFQEKVDALWIKTHIIEWADHCFTREWDLGLLYKHTLEFIEK